MRTFILAALLVVASSTLCFGQSARSVLNQRTQRVDFNAIAIADVFEYLRDTTQLNVYVNWAALEIEGVDRSTPISIRLRGVSYRKLLELMLNQAAPGRLAWYVDENVLHITTRELASAQMITRIYPVQDLLVEIPNFEGPRLGLTTEAGGSTFGGAAGQSEENSRSVAERAQDLIDLIQSVIEPDVWRDAGGFATIRFYLGNLIITAPRSVHEKLAKQPD